MPSELLKVHRLMQDLELLHRIQGASIKKANYLIETDATGPDRDLAELVLSDPFGEVRELRMAAAVNGTIQAKTEMYQNGEINTDTVDDEDIEYVVGAAWFRVALQLFPLPALPDRTDGTNPVPAN